MQYREMGKSGDKVSALGFGCMRLPRKGRKIDEDRAEKQIIYSIEQGVNFFDTAYLYPGSEAVLGKILAKGYRDKVMISTKLPPVLARTRKNMDSLLNTSLERLQTDYIDYYLVHNLSTKRGWDLLKESGVEDFLVEARETGKVRRVGFSFHGDKGQFKEIVDDYPWDMCLIQYNYLDENFQAGKEGLEYAASKGLGVAIMEPLKGGLLANKMPPAIRAVWEQGDRERTPAEWALRWVWNHPQVSVVLSGMNDEAQIQENIRVAGNAYPHSLSKEELETLDNVRDLLGKMIKIACTGCGYCMPCPAGVNIPMCFGYYNNKYLFQDRHIALHYLGMTLGADGGSPSYASLCTGCGKCEKDCPQALPVRKLLKEVSRDLEKFYFKPVAGLFRGYSKFRKGLKGRRKRKQV